MNALSNWLKNEESGQGMVEYGLIIALIAVVVIAALVILGPEDRRYLYTSQREARVQRRDTVIDAAEQYVW